MSKTSIEWCDVTWNPVRGCSRVSKGCEHCYAESFASRFVNVKNMAGVVIGPGPFRGFVHRVNGHPAWTGKVELLEKHLSDPLHWREPRRVFVNSMSDLFHEALPEADIVSIFRIMGSCPQHIFQVLTKRAARMLEILSKRRWRNLNQGECFLPIIPGKHRDEDPTALPNVWLGVSAEDQQRADERIPLLLRTPAAVRFVSYEPALGPLDILPYLFPDPPIGPRAGELRKGIDWVIAGGESGPGARPAHPQWFRDVRDQCREAGVAFFFKQHGEWAPRMLGDFDLVTVKDLSRTLQWPDGTFSLRVGKKKAGALLDGREWREFPNLNRQSSIGEAAVPLASGTEGYV